MRKQGKRALYLNRGHLIQFKQINMKKLNQLGKTLSKNQQRTITGGTVAPPGCVGIGEACSTTTDCCDNYINCGSPCLIDATYCNRIFNVCEYI